MNRRAAWILLVLFSLLWFGPLDYRKLVHPDEGRYAEIPREMVVSGDWLTPRLNGLKYFEKPALQYWTTAIAYELFGQSEWTSRLWTALTGFLGVLLTAAFCARLCGRQVALYAASIVSAMQLYGFMGHVNTLDMGVSFFLTLAVLAFVFAQRDEAGLRERRTALWLAYAAMALATLSKGLIGIVLPGAALVSYTLWQRDWGLWRRLHLTSGLAIYLLITAPWFIAVSLANPEFPRFFFIHEHFDRFLTKDHDRYEPMWFFIPVLFIGLIPWLGGLIGALKQGWRRDAAKHFQPRRFLLVWCLVVFSFFSVSDSKLASYILPIFPALAVLTAVWLSQITPRRLAWHCLSWLLLGLLGAALAPLVVRDADNALEAILYDHYKYWLMAAGLALAAAAGLAMRYAWRERATAAVLSLSFGGLLCCQLILNGHNSLAPVSSSWAIAQQVKPLLAPDIRLYSVNIYDQTLPFYLQRTVTLVNFQDELAFGIAQEPQKYLDLAGFERVWKSREHALAVMRPKYWRGLQARGWRGRVAAADTRRVFVANY